MSKWGKGLKNRIQWLDFGKGFTIFFVLVVHVVEGMYKTGQFSKYNILSELLMCSIFTFIMPCFFALSGFLYKSPSSIRIYLNMIKKKGINLLIPYVVFSIVYVVMQHFSSVNDLNSWKSLLTIYVSPISYLWFLYVLFFIFIMVGLMDLFKVSDNIQLVIYFIIFIVNQFLNLPFFLNGTFTWAICFYLGKIIKNNLNIFNNKSFVICSSIIMFIALLWQYSLGREWFETNDLTLITFVSKICSIFFMFYIFMNIKHKKSFDYFMKYGKYSLIIYLVHAPVASSLRILLMKLGLSNYYVLLVTITALSWFISILVCYLSDKSKAINAIFFPYKYLEGKRNKNV